MAAEQGAEYVVCGARPEDGAALEALARTAGLDLQPEAEAARPWSRLLVAVAPGAGQVLLGYLLAWQLADDLEIQSLVIAAEQRRRGVARALLGRLLEGARRQGLRQVLLEVARGNVAARALYEATGFVVTRTRVGYYGTDDGLEMGLAVMPARPLHLASTAAPSLAAYGKGGGC